MFKRFFRSNLVLNLAAWLLAGYMRLVFHTSNFTWIFDPDEGDVFANTDPRIFTFWHGRLALVPYARPHSYPIGILISRHGDGELIARTVTRFGITAIRGSTEKSGAQSEKGGAQALRQMAKFLKQEQPVGITPDGPRGPCMQISDGTLQLARLSGAVLTPITYATSRRRILKTWDKFHLPYPFSKGVFMLGKSLQIAKNTDRGAFETLRVQLENDMNDLMQSADRYVGQDPVRPGTSEDRK